MKRIALQPRLRLLAEMTPSGGRLADIGTDHGYLPVWLLQEGRIPSAIASDVGAEPLEHARRTAEEYETQGLDFRLCDGLSGIEPEETDTVVIAGMGGETIRDILRAAPWAADGHHTLLLQPMTKVELLRGWRAAGVLELTALRRAVEDLVLVHHKNHLYYLHIILLVYAVLPLTRRLVAAADRRLLNYALGIWFVLGCLAPTLKFFPPLSLVGGIPAQYPINLTWCAVGYGVLGDVLTQEAPRHRPRTFVWLYLAGTALTFGLTLAASVKTGALYQVFLQGSAPGVCLQAAGLYGFCAARWQNRDRWPVAETVSKASFCIYLTHLFFLDFLAGRGLSAGTLPPVWGVPVLVVAAFGGGFLVWLVLRRVPVVKTYLI